MNRSIIIAAGLCALVGLPACNDSSTDADKSAYAGEGQGACAGLARILDARSDSPAFSSLDASQQLFPDAVRCSVLPQFVPIDSWPAPDGPGPISSTAYQCTLFESDNAADASTGEAVWNQLVFDYSEKCLGDGWESMGATGRPTNKSDVAFDIFSYSNAEHPIFIAANGADYAPVSMGRWRPDDGVGQYVVFQVLAEEGS